MSKKTKLAAILKNTGLLPVFGSICGVVFKNIRIITYHRVLDTVAEEGFPFDENLVSATEADFIWQMKYIKQHYHPITLRDFHQHLAGGTKLPVNSIIITFDDGFSDNYEIVFPVLKSMGIPATFFITVGQIGEADSLWFDKVVYLLKKAVPGNYYLQSLDLAIDIDGETKNNTIQDLLKILKKTDNTKRLALINELESRFAHAFYKYEKQLSATMTWEQIIEMADHGMEIASHTMTHPILSRLSHKELEWELSESKRIIEEKTGHPCESISYPVGGPDSFNAETINLVRKYYKMGCTYVKGTSKIRNIDCHQLKRMHISTAIDRDLFEASLLCPPLFSR